MENLPYLVRNQIFSKLYLDSFINLIQTNYKIFILLKPRLCSKFKYKEVLMTKNKDCTISCLLDATDKSSNYVYINKVNETFSMGNK